MKLIISSMWSPDLAEPSTGLPENPSSFRLFVQMNLSVEGGKGAEAFSMFVCSLDRVTTTFGGFITQTLVMEQFDWTLVRDAVQRVLRVVDSVDNWDDVLFRLGPFLRASDYEVLPSRS